MIDVDALSSSGVDIQRVEKWLRDQSVCEHAVTSAARLPGGSQNILVVIECGDREMVLRRPPVHKRANSDETMRREMAVLQVLADTAVPHPRFIAGCSDPDVTGAAFYVMERVAGVDIDTAIAQAEDPVQASRSIGLSVADAAARLASIEVSDGVLVGLGRPERWLERQVGRWRAQLDSYTETAGYAGPHDLGPVDELGDWLSRHRPGDFSPGLIHGDFHLGNLMYSPAVPEVCAIVDWELATVGDPLLDLAHMLATWPDGRRAPAVRAVLPHLPAGDDVVNRYVETSGRDVGDLLWYRVLACYRLGIILEGTKARADEGKAPRETGDRLHHVAVMLFEQARDLARS